MLKHFYILDLKYFNTYFNIENRDILELKLFDNQM